MTATTPGDLVNAISCVDSSQRYELWLGGSFARGFEVSVDGQSLGKVKDELASVGGYVPVGRVFLSGGHPRFRADATRTPTSRPAAATTRSPAERDRPRDGTDEAAEQVITSPRTRRARLCGQTLDWVEIVAQRLAEVAPGATLTWGGAKAAVDSRDPAPAVAGGGGERPGPDAGADRLLRPADLRHLGPREPGPAVRGRAGRHDRAGPGRQRQHLRRPQRDACPPSPCMRHGERGLLSIALAPDFDTTAGTLRRLHRREDTGRDPRRRTAAPAAPASTAPPAPRWTCSPSPTRARPTTTAASSSSAPTATSTSRPGTAAARNDELHNAQRPRAACSARSSASTRTRRPCPYTVPADNPFAGAAAPRHDLELRAAQPVPLLLRPLDRRHGDRRRRPERQREEIDFAPARRSAGRQLRLELPRGPDSPARPPTPAAPHAPRAFVDPVFDYPPHRPPAAARSSAATSCATRASTASTAATSTRTSAAGEIRSLTLGLPAASCDTSTGLHVDNPNSFGEDSSGRIYVASGGGEVYRLQGAAPASCPSPSPDQQSDTRANTYVRIHAERRRSDAAAPRS